MTDRELLQKIYEELCGVKTDVGSLKTDVQGLKEEMAEVKSDIRGLKEEMAEVKSDIRGLKEEMAEVKSDIQDMKSDIKNMKSDIRDLQSRVSSLEMTLENETNKNIKVIAEGHMDLMRKLNEAIEVKNERELVILKVNVLENDMRIVKNKIGIA